VPERPRSVHRDRVAVIRASVQTSCSRHGSATRRPAPLLQGHRGSDPPEPAGSRPTPTPTPKRGARPGHGVSAARASSVACAPLCRSTHHPDSRSTPTGHDHRTVDHCLCGFSIWAIADGEHTGSALPWRADEATASQQGRHPGQASVARPCVALACCSAAGCGSCSQHRGGHESRTAAPATRASTAPGSTLPNGIDLTGWKLSLPERTTTVMPPRSRAALRPLADSCPGRRPDVLGAGGGGRRRKNSDHPAPSAEPQLLPGRKRRTHPVRLAHAPAAAQRRGGIILGQIPAPTRSAPSPTSCCACRTTNSGSSSAGRQGSKLINYPLLDNVGRGGPLDYTITISARLDDLLRHVRGQTRQTTAPVPRSRRPRRPFPGRRLPAGRRLRGPQDGGASCSTDSPSSPRTADPRAGPRKRFAAGAHAHPQVPMTDGAPHPRPLGRRTRRRGLRRGADLLREYLTEVANRTTGCTTAGTSGARRSSPSWRTGRRRPGEPTGLS